MSVTFTATPRHVPGEPETWLIVDGDRTTCYVIPRRRAAIHDDKGSYFVKSYEMQGNA